MSIRALALPPLCWLALGAGNAAAEQRPPLPAASAIRVGNYGSPSVMLESREQLRPILNELNALRGKSWNPGEARLSCYATLVLLAKGKQVALYRIRPDVIVERATGKGQASYTLAVTEADAPRLTKLLAEITAPKCD